MVSQGLLFAAIVRPGTFVLFHTNTEMPKAAQARTNVIRCMVAPFLFVGIAQGFPRGTSHLNPSLYRLWGSMRNNVRVLGNPGNSTTADGGNNRNLRSGRNCGREPSRVSNVFSPHEDVDMFANLALFRQNPVPN